MDNRAGEMLAFVEVVDRGSFSQAGRRLNQSPSAISKLVSRLEERLGVALLVRTTRALRLTPEGEAYLARARAILASIDEAENLIVGRSEVPRGRLRVSASVGFGMVCIVPILPRFLALYPGIELDLSLTDEVIDLVGERTDIAIRSGELRDSTMRARKLLESPRVVVASANYLKRHGTPQHPNDLEQHNCLGFNFRQRGERWPFRLANGETVTIAVTGSFLGNTGPMVRELARAGVGICRMGRFAVESELQSGELVEILAAFSSGETELIHALYSSQEHLSARIRAFVDFVAERNGKTSFL